MVTYFSQKQTNKKPHECLLYHTVTPGTQEPLLSTVVHSLFNLFSISIAENARSPRVDRICCNDKEATVTAILLSHVIKERSQPDSEPHNHHATGEAERKKNIYLSKATGRYIVSSKTCATEKNLSQKGEKIYKGSRIWAGEQQNRLTEGTHAASLSFIPSVLCL